MDISINELITWLAPSIFSLGFMYLVFKPKRKFDVWLFMILISIIPFVNMFAAFFSFLFVIFVKIEDYVE